jgi:hypothetical protein
MTDQDDKFIKFPADIKKIPSCEKFIGEYPGMALPLSSRFDNVARILADGKPRQGNGTSTELHDS